MVVGRLSTYITVCEVAVHSAADISLYLFHDCHFIPFGGGTKHLSSYWLNKYERLY